MKYNLKKNYAYEIYWHDTYSYNGWYNLSEIIKLSNPKMTETIGYFIYENKNYIVLCTSIEHEKDFKPYRDPIWIPKGFIVYIKKITRRK